MARLAGPRLLTTYPHKPPCGYPMLLWHQAAPHLRKHPFLSLDCDDDCDLASILTKYFPNLTRALASSAGAARQRNARTVSIKGLNFLGGASIARTRNVTGAACIVASSMASTPLDIPLGLCAAHLRMPV